jgi:hypothetical protein
VVEDKVVLWSIAPDENQGTPGGVALTGLGVTVVTVCCLEVSTWAVAINISLKLPNDHRGLLHLGIDAYQLGKKGVLFAVNVMKTKTLYSGIASS